MSFLLTKSVLKYAAMPEIMPRVKTLVFGGFGYIPFFIASVYQMVGLLPKNHPYLLQENIGRFGIRHVIAQAATNIKFSFKNIDQIILFIAVLAGLVIFIIQFFAMASVFLLQPAAALPTNWDGFFTIVNPGFRSQDISFMMLDMVFGVPHPSLGAAGFFESCVSTATVCQDAQGNNLLPMNTGLLTTINPGIAAQLSPLAPGAPFPFPFHEGLHRLFGIYSTALLVIAMMITSYFVATIIGETAQSGTPFGRRFNKTWAPLRIVVAFGLLVPLTVGLNSSQYMVLYAAKYGSAFASNGWRYFNDTLSTSYLGAGQRLISTPNIPELSELTQFMFVARTCRYIHDFYHLKQLQDDTPASGTPPAALPAGQGIEAYALLPDNNAVLINTGTSYAGVKASFTDNVRTMKIRFGIRDDDKYEASKSNVKAICGEVTIPYTDGTDVGLQEPYVREIQEGYFDLVRDLWHDTFWVGVGGGGAYPAFTAAQNNRYKFIANNKVTGLPLDINHNVGLDPEYVQNINDKAQATMRLVVTTAITNAVTSGLWGGPYNGTAANADPLYSRGWASAGIWYNRIAQVNGHLSAAVFATPEVTTYPAIMEQVAGVKAKYDSVVLAKDRFKPVASGVDDIGLLLDQQNGTEYASALYTAITDWETASGVELQQSSNSNPIISFIKSFFGLTGLYNMRDNQANQTHPLAQLSGVGKSLVEGSIRSLSYAGLATFFGALGVAPGLMKVASNFLITFAMLGLTVGFILFYVVPFLPFIYFFFAVGGWIKGIFEAMVGAPLWALAHIRIDGNGLPGNAALNGYFLIFEVFLRPILIVFGMLASISTYSALVSVLNDIFSLVTENTAGYDIESEIGASRDTLNYMRAEIDQFFFTVIYVIIVYMLGMSSFKLVDTMPNNILRWMGQSVATFGDQREDPAQNLVSRASIGSQQALSQAGRGLQSTSKAIVDAGAG
tara:strand:- start:24268 stop:27132 length:2865 start_codon:yes stop_codon:yes gene_type:complete